MEKEIEATVKEQEKQSDLEKENQKEENQERPPFFESERSDYGRYIKNVAEEFNNSGIKEQQITIKNLYFVKENSGFVLGDQADLNDISLYEREKKDNDYKNTFVCDECVVEDRGKLIVWLTEHYNDFEMAFLIALAVFEKTPYLWVYDMAEKLFCMMEGDKETARQNKIKIPNNQRIKMAGGMQYHDDIYNHTGKIESEFIRFQNSEYGQRVLESVWTEFIFFRETLIKWLNWYISDRNYSKTIMAVKALAKLAELDFDYFSRCVLGKLFTRNEFMADFAVSQIMGYVYQHEQYKNNVDKLFKYWSREGHLHYSLTALMICVNEGWGQEKVQLAVEGYIDQLLREIKSNKGGEYEKQLPLFFSIGRRKAVYFKAIVTILYNRLMEYNGQKHQIDKAWTGLVFFLLLQIDDSQSHIDVNRKEKQKEMIFVKMCLIKNDAAPKVQELWKYIWKSRELHKLTKEFLENYLYQYGGCKQEDIDYLRQFLYSFQDSEADRNNMEFFLKKISFKVKRPVKTAERISNKF